MSSMAERARDRLAQFASRRDIPEILRQKAAVKADRILDKLPMSTEPAESIRIFQSDVPAK